MTDRISVKAIRRHGPETSETDHDLVAIEAPLAVHVTHPAAPAARPLGILMRTPGDDRDLVLGLLYAEGLIDSAIQVQNVVTRAPTETDGTCERVDITLTSDAPWDETAATRALSATSACGMCGRLSVTALDVRKRAGGHGTRPLSRELIHSVPDRLRAGQRVFAETGGLHAAAAFDDAGALIALREDVGRHNAVDKLVGALLDDGRIPLAGATLGVTGRVAYEIVQKAARSGFGAIVAIGAPSSLAIDACRAAGITLVGFVRDQRFNVYAGAVGPT